jgi:hypothetical protein
MSQTFTLTNVNSWRRFMDLLVCPLRAVRKSDREGTDKDADKIDYNDVMVIINVDSTTFTYSKKGKEETAEFKTITQEKKYTGWGAEVVVGKDTDDERSVILMDKHVKEAYDYIVEKGIKIIFITERAESEGQQLINELYALGIKDPELMFVEKGSSKAKTFLSHYESVLVSEDGEDEDIREPGESEKSSEINEETKEEGDYEPVRDGVTFVCVLDNNRDDLEEFAKELEDPYIKGVELFHYKPF